MKPKLAILILILVLGLASSVEACPTCKLALEGGSDHSQQGFAYSIMFMMAMPFLIAFGWTVFIWRTVQKAKRLAPAEL